MALDFVPDGTKSAPPKKKWLTAPRPGSTTQASTSAARPAAAASSSAGPSRAKPSSERTKKSMVQSTLPVGHRVVHHNFGPRTSSSNSRPPATAEKRPSSTAKRKASFPDDGLKRWHPRPMPSMASTLAAAPRRPRSITPPPAAKGKAVEREEPMSPSDNLMLSPPEKQSLYQRFKGGAASVVKTVRDLVSPRKRKHSSVSRHDDAASESRTRTSSQGSLGSRRFKMSGGGEGTQIGWNDDEESSEEVEEEERGTPSPGKRRRLSSSDEKTTTSATRTTSSRKRSAIVSGGPDRMRRLAQIVAEEPGHHEEAPASVQESEGEKTSQALRGFDSQGSETVTDSVWEEMQRRDRQKRLAQQEGEEVLGPSQRAEESYMPIFDDSVALGERRVGWEIDVSDNEEMQTGESCFFLGGGKSHPESTAPVPSTVLVDETQARPQARVLVEETQLPPRGLIGERASRKPSKTKNPFASATDLSVPAQPSRAEPASPVRGRSTSIVPETQFEEAVVAAGPSADKGKEKARFKEVDDAWSGVKPVEWQPPLTNYFGAPTVSTKDKDEARTAEGRGTAEMRALMELAQQRRRATEEAERSGAITPSSDTGEAEAEQGLTEANLARLDAYAALRQGRGSSPMPPHPATGPTLEIPSLPSSFQTPDPIFSEASGESSVATADRVETQDFVRELERLEARIHDP